MFELEERMFLSLENKVPMVLVEQKNNQGLKKKVVDRKRKGETKNKNKKTHKLWEGIFTILRGGQMSICWRY